MRLHHQKKNTKKTSIILYVISDLQKSEAAEATSKISFYQNRYHKSPPKFSLLTFILRHILVMIMQLSKYIEIDKNKKKKEKNGCCFFRLRREGGVTKV